MRLGARKICVQSGAFFHVCFLICVADRLRTKPPETGPLRHTINILKLSNYHSVCNFFYYRSQWKLDLSIQILKVKHIICQFVERWTLSVSGISTNAFCTGTSRPLTVIHFKCSYSFSFLFSFIVMHLCKDRTRFILSSTGGTVMNLG